MTNRITKDRFDAKEPTSIPVDIHYQLNAMAKASVKLPSGGIFIPRDTGICKLDLETAMRDREYWREIVKSVISTVVEE